MKVRHAFCMAAVLCLSTAHAAYPEKPIKIVVPYVAGSAVDVVSRIVADGLRIHLNQTVVVENRPGANAMIGLTYLARSAPDGYTLGPGVSDTHAINPLVYRSISYNAHMDFTPVASVSGYSMFLVARPKFPADDAAGMLAIARKAPETVSYGTWGLGSLAHFWGMRMEQTADVKLFHVPFQGTPATQQALMGEQIDMMFLLPDQAVQAQQSGHVKILGTTATEVSSAWPTVRPLGDQGFKGFVGTQWLGMFAPAGTPPDIVDTLNQAINASLRDPVTVEKLRQLSMYTVIGSPQDLGRIVRDSQTMWKALVESMNFQPFD